MPIMGQPNVYDRFYYIERRCFDRSGWNELHNATLGNVQNVNDILLETLMEDQIVEV